MQVPIFYETINFIEVIFPTRSKRWNQTKHYCYDKVAPTTIMILFILCEEE